MIVLKLCETVRELLAQAKTVMNAPTPENTLPQNAWFLKDGAILCLPTENGEARFPYDADGMVVWAHSTGYIDACESMFNIFKKADCGEDPAINFWGGVKKDGEWFPVSVTGASRQLMEPKDVQRCVIFALRCVYYIAETADLIFAVRMHVDEKKTIHFAVSAENKSTSQQDCYLAAYFEGLLRYYMNEEFWDRMTKFGRRYENGSVILHTVNGGDNYLTINRAFSRPAEKLVQTVSRGDFIGVHGRTLTNAESLRTGTFVRCMTGVNTTQLPVAADMMHFSLKGGENVRIDYEMTVSHEQAVAEALLKVPVQPDAADGVLKEASATEQEQLDRMQLRFGGWKSDRVNDEVMNRFVKCVQKQVSFCALGKNYAGPYLGFRDVFQQLESCLIWQPERARRQILVAMNHILSTGRTPRQFSIPAHPNAVPSFDLREFIDQGVWVISTLYTYLCYTGDFSILDETCGYYDLLDEKSGKVQKSAHRDTVLDHLLQIADYLLSKLDTEYGTHCLRAMFGDWNDALDGLGHTTDPDKTYGSGVTVMATLQFRQNLQELMAILRKLGKHQEKLPIYRDALEQMEKGLLQYAVDTNDTGEKRVIHGWGDRIAYKVGSFCDPDGSPRVSLAANAFWGISGILEKDLSLRESVLHSLELVDSKYGMKTFDKPFPKGTPGVGRISYITPGTYENSCAYVHAGMFGIMGLFAMGEPQRAWEQLEKSIVITHPNATMTPFVMPNSYCENPEYGMDGDSMGDWYTGSGTVLIKNLVKYGFGVRPTLDGINLWIPSVFPAKTGELVLPVRGCHVTVRRSAQGEPSVTVNGCKTVCGTDALSGCRVLTLGAEYLSGELTIEITG